MARVNSDEFAALWAAIADVRAVLDQHSARLDDHFEFHQAHAAGFAMLSDQGNEHTATLDRHTEMLREILRRLDAA